MFETVRLLLSSLWLEQKIVLCDHSVNPSLSPLATHRQFSDPSFLDFIFSLLIPETTEVHEQI